MKALFLVLHRPNRSPGQRYRHEQYLEHLTQHRVQCQFSPLLSKREDKIFYGRGVALQKARIGINSFFLRLKDVLRANQFDILYIYRDAFFFGTFFERLLAMSKAKIIYDFDDAIWLPDKNPNQGLLQRLKKPRKTNTIIKLADQVIVGNEYLKEYALQFNDHVTIIPSTIDFGVYQMKRKSNQRNDNIKVCIGWTGSFSTIKHFETVLPTLLEIKKKYKDGVYFKLIGDPKYENQDLGIQGIPWNSATEVEDLSELDIGLMPLPDNEWTRGKCAMKGLQYMALEIPTIMSPVGVNKDIIQDGENGFLASSEEEWIEKLSLLIESPELRERIGRAGRKTVERDYSVEANKDKWLKVFTS